MSVRTSLRWRLTLSYAAIALLAALALGAVLLITLRGYYATQETQYLAGNTRALGGYLAGSMTEGPDGSPVTRTLQNQVNGLAFLVQARVRLLDAHGRTLADSGKALNYSYVSIEPPMATTTVKQNFVRKFYGGRDEEQQTMIIIARPVAGEPVLAVPSIGVEPAWSQSMPAFERGLPAFGTLYGFGLEDQALPPAGPRSHQVVQEPLRGTAGQILGFIELSEGPAYGVQIVEGVARALILAGVAATLLAAGAGWLLSRRITAPVLALAAVTERMAQGDLSARAAPTGQDEVSLLGRTYNEMAARVEQTVLALRRFVADAAHQLNTPLTALRTDLELAGTEPGTAQRTAYLQRAQAQIDRLARLTDNLLDLSRIEGSQDPACESVELVALLGALGEVYASRAEQKGLALSLLVPAAPLFVWGSRELLGTALENLLDNAVKFTPEDGRVDVTLRVEGGWIELVVEDSGIGIPAEDLPYLGQRFHRGRNVAAYPGSGLGLAVVRAIAESHGGRLEAGSRGGQGARMVLWLPLRGEFASATRPAPYVIHDLAQAAQVDQGPGHAKCPPP